MNAHHFDRLRALERWQDRGKAPREHCLAGTRRPAEQAVVGSGRRNEECPDSLVLAANITQIGAVSRCAHLCLTRGGQPIAGAAAQYARRAREALDNAQGKPFNECRLVCAGCAQDEHRHPSLLGGLGDRKSSVTGTHLAVE